MKVSDYIVEAIIHRGITDLFGYPGGMVTHLMDSLAKYSGKITAHVTYHEQGAAFAACGYAQACGKPGVAYATSGPGATNLITGICDAYFDSIPTLFITGQVNTTEARGDHAVRQRGFQETDIVSIVKPVTKFAALVDDAQKIKWYLDKAFYYALSDRKGPVLLDIPMNLMRAEVDPETLVGFEAPKEEAPVIEAKKLRKLAELAAGTRRPVLLVGSGIKAGGAVPLARKVLRSLDIPVISTMLSIDILPDRSYGFIGAYGGRAANFIAAKSDLLISLGARLDVRQVGAKRENFAPGAKLVRIDVDEGELAYQVRNDELDIPSDVTVALGALENMFRGRKYTEWRDVCETITHELKGMDEETPNRFVRRLSENFADDSVITTDVGQNQVWVAQSMMVKGGQKVLFSGGHGAMGYSLPAAIGAALAARKTVYCICGDGGFQMNIQELQTLAREQLPVKILLFNNASLGMIRHFQEMYFGGNYVQTTAAGGYTVPDFGAVARAYGIGYALVTTPEDITGTLMSGNHPQLIEIKLTPNTHVFPKLEFGKPNQDQEPSLPRELYERLSGL